MIGIKLFGPVRSVVEPDPQVNVFVPHLFEERGFDRRHVGERGVSEEDIENAADDRGGDRVDRLASSDARPVVAPVGGAAIFVAEGEPEETGGAVEEFPPRLDHALVTDGDFALRV